MTAFEHTLQNPEGIHARPAGLLVKQAQQYESTVTLVKNGKEADLKRLFAVMGLAAKQGEVVSLRIEGDDEEEAAQQLQQYLQENM